MASLITLDRLKTLLEIPAGDTSRDEVLSLLGEQVSGVVEEYCGRQFGQSTYSEFYSGDNSPLLVLRQRPVLAITSVWVDGAGWWGQGADPFAADTLLDATGYAVEADQPDGSSRCGLLRRVDDVWPRPFQWEQGVLTGRAPGGVQGETGNIKVVYSAGYASVPSPVQLAVAIGVSRFLKTLKAGGLVAGETTPGYSYSLFTGNLKPDGISSLPPEALSLLSRYRNLPVA
ncbi:MAG: hypothetical protein ABGY75_14555 [Gemmataceae bacterium]